MLLFKALESFCKGLYGYLFDMGHGDELTVDSNGKLLQRARLVTFDGCQPFRIATRTL
jgi:hypothetical protein